MITDYFALLDEPRRPWIDPRRLKAKFLALSAGAHPDKIHTTPPADRDAANQRFVELNAAFKCLREPRERLRHLLELELGDTTMEIREIPPDLADMFTEIAKVRREVKAFLAEAARVQSPLLRVQMFERAQEWTDRLRAIQQRLSDREAQLHEELQVLDADWSRLESDPVQHGTLLQRVERIYRVLSFYTRWHAQIQETVVQLSL